MAVFERIVARNKYYRKKYFFMFLLAFLTVLVFLGKNDIEKRIDSTRTAIKKNLSGKVIIQYEGNQEGIAVAKVCISENEVKKIKKFPNVTALVGENEIGVRSREISNVNNLYEDKEAEEYDFIISGISDFSIYEKGKIKDFEILEGNVEDISTGMVAISQIVAEENGIELGDVLTFESDLMMKEIKVGVIYQCDSLSSVSPIYSNLVNRIFTTSKIVDELSREDGFARCEAKVSNPDQVEEFAQQIRKNIFSEKDYIDVYGVAIEYRENRQMLDYVSVLIKLVGSFWLIFAVLIYMLLIEQYYSGKKKENYILKSLGEKPVKIWIQFGIELCIPVLFAMILGVAGYNITKLLCR